jgi:hypothetical protein
MESQASYDLDPDLEAAAFEVESDDGSEVIAYAVAYMKLIG